MPKKNALYPIFFPYFLDTSLSYISDRTGAIPVPTATQTMGTSAGGIVIEPLCMLVTSSVPSFYFAIYVVFNPVLYYPEGVVQSFKIMHNSIASLWIFYEEAIEYKRGLMGGIVSIRYSMGGTALGYFIKRSLTVTLSSINALRSGLPSLLIKCFSSFFSFASLATMLKNS